MRPYDRCGRLADRTVLRALHGGPGHPLALTPLAGSVHVAPGPAASVRVWSDEYLRLPVGVRRACRLVPGDRVLLVADPSAVASRTHAGTTALTTHLRQHVEQRGSGPHDQLLRPASGRPITRRRYDHLWTRLGEALPWEAAQRMSTHWLRHTTLTWVERASPT